MCGERRGAYRVFVGKTDRKRPSKTPNRWEDNIKLDVQEKGWGAWTVLMRPRIRTGVGLL